MAEQNSPYVDVLWWDATGFNVRCYYCEDIHRHTFDWSLKKPYSTSARRSQCSTMDGGRYACEFPFDERTGHVGYKIDKKRARFVNVCAVQDVDDSENECDQLAKDFASKATISANPLEKSEEDRARDMAQKQMVKDEEQLGYPERTIMAIADCVCGRVEKVEKYLLSSSDKSLFIHRKGRGGNTPLILAAREKSSDMVSLLLDHGSSVNAANAFGRTALMEADKKLAADLAQHTFNRDANRRQFVQLLSGNDRKRKTAYGPPPTAAEYSQYSFKRSPLDDSIVLYAPIAKYPVTSAYKTVARLERGKSFPSISAMSGWSHENQSTWISGKNWRNEVFAIATDVGHGLAPSACDQGQRGQFSACHAEKQLIAYFLDRHVFLPRDKNSSTELEIAITAVKKKLDAKRRSAPAMRKPYGLNASKKPLELALWNGDDWLLGDKYDKKKLAQMNNDILDLEQKLSAVYAKNVRRLECQLQKLEQYKKEHRLLVGLAERRPSVSLKQAVILVSSEICNDCMEFTRKVNEKFELTIELVRCTE